MTPFRDRGSAAALLLALTTTLVSPTFAAEEPKFAALAEQFRTSSLRVLLLLQTVADYQSERSFAGANGFSVANARFGIAGDLDRGFAYLVRANFINTPTVLDAYLSYSPNSVLTFDMGQFKVPFSKEFLTSAGTIDFVNRAQAISALGPGRQLGLQARAHYADRRVAIAGGLWNGNAASSHANDDNDFMYAGRLTLHPLAGKSGDGALEMGVSAAGSRDTDVKVLGGAIAHFSGRRTLGGADLRWTPGPWLVSGELIGARYAPSAGGRIEPSGFHATLGRSLDPEVQALVRWERYQPAGFGPDQDLVIAGINFNPSHVVGFQANDVIPTATGPEHHQFLLNAQVYFGK